MRLAQRMDRILVESAFEVLVRARALEAAGKNIIHLEIGEPDFPTPVPIPLLESKGFSLDLDMLRDRLSNKTKMLVLNSPQNPTGGVIPPDDIKAIADLVRDRDLIVLSDEIYGRVVYGDTPASIAS